MTPALRRRRFLQGTLLAGLAPLAGRAAAQEAPPLPVPPLLDAAGVGTVSLTAQPGRTEFWPGRASDTAGYNGGFLGPTIRVQRGADVPFVVRNRLAEPTTVHWHGLLIPSEVDGGPHNEIAPGGEWKPVVPIRQAATTAWYHAHPHMRTGPQVYAGLAGMLVVTDAEERALGLPSRYGVDDLPLILQDRLFDRDGRMVYPRNPMAAMHGVQGNVLLVNGARRPRARVPAGLVRLRLLNAANARVFDLAFEDGRDFHWIGTEGGLLRAPVALRQLALAPGQRAELLVDFSDGRPATLVERYIGGSMGMVGGTPQVIDSEPLLQFAPSGAGVQAAAIPTRLAQWETPAGARVARRRRMALTMGMPGMMGGMGMGGGGMHEMADGPPHGIDGRPFDMARVDHAVRLGDVEVWEVSSRPGMMMDVEHPFHIHGVHFEVLRRGGRAPGPEDQGRRDTVLVDTPVELLVHFTQPAPRLPFMYHCHILEHEDLGMMGQFTVA